MCSASLAPAFAAQPAANGGGATSGGPSPRCSATSLANLRQFLWFFLPSAFFFRFIAMSPSAKSFWHTGSQAAPPQSDGAALPRRPQMGISPAAEYLLA